MGALSKVLKSSEVSKTTKLRIYKTIIRPTVVYGSEVWTLNKSDLGKLARWEKKIIRKILGGKRTEETWRRRTNQEVLDDLQGTNIIGIVKKTEIKMAGTPNAYDRREDTKKTYKTCNRQYKKERATKNQMVRSGETGPGRIRGDKLARIYN